MERIRKLNKVLNVREKEENDAQIAHYQSVSIFEKIANELYERLKEKENAETIYEKMLQTFTPIYEINNQFEYIEYLKQEIIRLQRELHYARKEMDRKQGKLKEAHIEVKKIEKMIHHRIDLKKEEDQKQEQQFLDEIGQQNYFKKTMNDEVIAYE